MFDCSRVLEYAKIRTVLQSSFAANLFARSENFAVAPNFCFKAGLAVKPLEMTFHSHANNTHYHNKGFALNLVLKGRVLELGNDLLKQPMGVSFILSGNVTL